MEVTKANFNEVLSKLEKLIPRAQFIAFDTEFTGLKVEGADNINYYDTLNDVYLKVRDKAEKFLVIQYGVVLFFYNDEEGSHTHEAFNFYVFPGTSNPDMNFTCQSRCLTFLANNGFDFNKVFHQGIPFLNRVDKERLINELTSKYERMVEQSPQNEVTVPEENKTTINQIHKKIEELLQVKRESTFTTDVHNGYIRRLIYKTTQEKFGSKVYLQTNKDQTITICVGVTSEDIKNIKEARFLNEKQEIMDSMGFTKVIQLLIQSGKPIVGHNPLLDLLFTVKQFLQPLPNNYEEFKDIVHFIFPKLIDTKFMACEILQEHSKFSLTSLLNYVKANNFIPSVKIKSDGEGYNMDDDWKAHEAGFDAYVTGLCFLAMLNTKGNYNNGNTFENMLESPVLDPIWNKINLPRLHEIPFMNLGGEDVEPRRLGVFHLTFPRNWKRDDIFNLFKDCGFISISWINDTSAYLGVKDEYIPKMKKCTMNVNDEYKLTTFDEFKKSLQNERNGNYKNHVTPRGKNDATISSSPVNIKTNVGECKRLQEEDLGEAVSPPPKKKRLLPCSE